MPYANNPTASKWHEGHYLTAYELARSGMSTSNIHRTIGVSQPTWDKWCKRYPYLKVCVERGRGHSGMSVGAGATQRFVDYVYGMLPDNLKRLWDEIDECVEAPNGYERVQALLANEGYRTRQHMFIHALIDSNFNTNQALRKCGITRGQFMGWEKNDPDFIALLDEIHWYKGNFFEHALMKLVAAGETSAVIFANKTYNRDRGYAERVTVDGNVQHDHTHAHIPIPLEVLGLDLETRKKVLQAMRSAGRDENGKFKPGHNSHTVVGALPQPGDPYPGPASEGVYDAVYQVKTEEDDDWDDERGEPRRRGGDAA